MALKPCRECKHMVSTSAKTCPNCGVRNPIANPTPIMFVALLLGIGIVWWGISSSIRSSAPPPPVPAAASTPAPVPHVETAVNNWDGWARAQIDCKYAADKLAKYGDPKWPWLSYFGTYHTGNTYLSGTATLIEKDAEFQNGFGAMEHVRVVCDYDLDRKTVVNVSLDQK